MNLEDYPPLSTQPIGFEADGTVIKLFPLAPTQLVTIAGGSTPMISLGAQHSVGSSTDVLSPAGWWAVWYGDGRMLTLLLSDGETTEVGNAAVYYWQITFS